MFEPAFSADRADEIFGNTALRQYTRDLRFSTVVNLLTQVVFDLTPSVGAAYAAASEEIPVSDDSVYAKLNSVEPQVAAALVHDSVVRFGEIVTDMGAAIAPLIDGYRTRIIDGNRFASTERRIKPLRTLKAGPLPGKALVVLDPQLRLATRVIRCEDGHARERSLFGAIAPLVEAGDLWIADRNFCTTALLFTIAERAAAFVMRQHGGLVGEPLTEPVRVGHCDSGEVFEQLLDLVDSRTGDRLEVRRITVRMCVVRMSKPTRDGETELHLLTNLQEEAASAVRIAELYRTRWTIETLFQELILLSAHESSMIGGRRLNAQACQG